MTEINQSPDENKIAQADQTFSAPVRSLEERQALRRESRGKGVSASRKTALRATLAGVAIGAVGIGVGAPKALDRINDANQQQAQATRQDRAQVVNETEQRMADQGIVEPKTGQN